ncbi:2'-5' RNA ligase family protein [Limosilactobacillus pontis]|uniref:2'-5' RNA ligase family protein n=1 Tax=Limosilactobacillus pontis TaxID=35787 RepID=A0ABT7UZR4_9LACO|nr:2'-5' RNA ligase family protein [Limosilactobacillus pontis]MDM8266555.1 2'-5' RNA ligase family protein [Limosilactobacillus pontis]
MKDLQALYAAIDEHGHQALAAHQEEVDPYLGVSNDDRRGLALILHLPAHVTRNINFALQPLKTADRGLYCYPAADMHITVMDIIGAHPGFHLDPARLADYRRVVAETVAEAPAIDWHLAGLMLSPGAVMVKGFYSGSLATLRARLRDRLARADLPVQERYATQSGHVTVARFARPLPDSDAVIKLVDADRALSFGDFTSTRADLVVHDWYNHRVHLVNSVAFAE